MTITKYLACKQCIGKTIEDVLLITPCLRFYEEGYEFPDDCPKEARGVYITSTPNWEKIGEQEFMDNWTLNQRLGTRVRLFDEE